MTTHLENIHELPAWCWDQMRRAAKDRRSEFRWLNLATVDSDGLPQVRTVVVREAVQSEHRVSFHTDMRSKKVAELTDHKAVALHLHSRRHAVQMRMAGLAVFSSEQRRERAWQTLHEGAKATYAQSLSPGSTIEPDVPRLNDGTPSTDDGFSNFVVFDVWITSIDWLQLDSSGHRRALITCQPGGGHKATWLAP
ncbi:MAG: pyridoxamine 5'-phosphate oxidase family protein [Pseudomonadota bacterium]